MAERKRYGRVEEMVRDLSDDPAFADEVCEGIRRRRERPIVTDAETWDRLCRRASPAVALFWFCFGAFVGWAMLLLHSLFGANGG